MAIIITGSSNDTINGTANADQISSDGGNDVINAGAGNDIVLAGGGNDTVDGGAGEDFIDGGDGNDKLFGGLGNDIILTGRGFDLAYGGGGADLIDARLSGGGVANDVVLIGDGFDSAAAYAANGARTTQVGNDILFGGDGNDTLYGDSADASTASAGGDDALSGGDGNDTLYGEGGNDILFGDAGNDILVGGRGADRLTGGSGNDIFVFDASASGSDSTAASLDIIYDFTQGSDKIDLRSILGATDLIWGDKTARAHGVWYGAQGNDTFIYADVNGDSVAELTVRLNGKYTLAVSDFLGVVAAPAPTLAPVADAGAVTEGGGAISGNVLSNDSPAGLTVSGVKFGSTSGTVGQNLVGTYGTLRLNANGSYTYTLANGTAAVESLTAGQVVNEVFTYTASTGSATASATLTIAVTGTNDTATISGTTSAAVQEDGTLSAGGTLSVSDADAGQARLQATTSTKTYGTFVVAENGSWIYTLNNAASNVQSLKAGQTVQDTLTVTSLDGTASKTLAVNITGKNDAPVAVADTKVTQEDTAVTIDVLANDTDVDSGAVLSIKAGSVSVAGGAATGTAVISNGKIVFTPAANFNGQATITYRTTDGSADSAPATVTVTVTPVNDAATITGTTSGAVQEDGTQTANGTLVVADADAGEARLQAATVATTYGTFVVAANGSWTYTLNNAASNVQSLKAGQTVQDTLTVTSLDGTATKTLTVNITGKNDAPVAVADTKVTPEDTPVTIDVLANDTDVDNGAVLSIKAGSVSVTGGAATGTAVISNGKIVFTPAANFNGQATITYRTTDGSADSAPATVTVTVTPVNDPAIISGTDAGTVTEDTTAVASGQLLITDIDSPAAFVPQPTHAGAYGSFAVDAAGNWTYKLDNANAAVQGLNAGQTLTDTFTVLSVDGTPKNVVITINGVTDVSGRVTDGPVAGATVYLDKDGNGVVSAGDEAVATTDGQGNFSFNTSLNVGGWQLLATGGIDTVTGEANGLILSAPAGYSYINPLTTLVRSIAGPNAGPEVVAAAETAVLEAFSLDSGLDLANTDIYADNFPAQQAAAIIATAAIIVQVEGGNADPFAALAGGVADASPGGGTAALGAVVQEAAPQQSTIFENTAQAIAQATTTEGIGTALNQGYFNDAPPAAADDIVSTNEDVPVLIDVLANDTDADNPAPAAANAGLSIKEGSVSVVNGASVGTAQIVGGQIQFTPAANFNGTATINYVTTDGTLDSAQAAVTVNVIAVNDAPYVAGQGTAAPTNTGILASISGVVTTAVGPGTSADQIFSMVVQPDGKLLVAGFAQAGQGRGQDFAVVRYNPDGSLDTSFGTGGKVILPIDAGSGADLARSMAVQSDGKIVVAGIATIGGTAPNGPDVALVRLNANGSVDTGFGANGIVTRAVASGNIADIAVSMVIQPDGRIVTAGWSGTTPATQDFLLMRFNADGTPDTTSFGANGAGGFNGYVTTPISAGAFQDQAQSLTLHDGKILVTGFTSSTVANNQAGDIALARYNADGSLDHSFGVGGKVTISINSTAIGSQVEVGSSVTVLPGGKVLVGGWTTTGTGQDFVLLRFNDNGSLDNTFGQLVGAGPTRTGYVTTNIGTSSAPNDLAQSMLVQPDGKIVLAGFATNSNTTSTGQDFALVRYNVDGTLDTSFGVGGKVTTAIGPGATPDQGASAALLPDGRIVVGGFTGNLSPDFALVRYTANGVLDPTFNTSVTVQRGLAFGYTLPSGWFADPDAGDTLIYSVAMADGSALPSWLSFNTSTGRIAGTPGSTDPDAVLRITATDSGGSTASQIVTIKVNDAPVALPSAFTTNEDTALSGTLITLDPEGDLVLSFTTVTGPSHGTLVLNNGGGFTYTPAANYSGSDSFVYRSTDAFGASSANATVTLTVNPVNDAPVAVNDTITTDEDVPVTINVLANDTDVDNIAPAASNAGLSIKAGSVSVVGGAATGSAQIVGNQIQFTPAANFNGTATISYVATDGTLDSAPATVTVNVTPVNDAPTQDGTGEAPASPVGILNALSGVVLTSVAPGPDQAFGVAVQPDGKFLTVGFAGAFGSAADNDFALLRYNADGSLDSSFGDGGKAVLPLPGVGNDQGRAVAVQGDGRIVVAGIASFTASTGTGSDMVLVRYNADGTLDTSFGGTGIVTRTFGTGASADGLNSVVIQPDGRILASGYATIDGVATDFLLVRYLGDGTPDPAFGINGVVTTAIDAGNFPDVSQSMALMSDGRIVLAGWTYANASAGGSGANDFAVVRYNANGTLDTSFSDDGKATFSISSILGNNTSENGRSVKVLPDGRILVGGWTTGTGQDFALVRLNADGSLDDTFGQVAGAGPARTGYVTTNIGSSSAPNDQAHTVLVQPDGRILLVGFANNSSGTTGQDIALARYSADGTLEGFVTRAIGPAGTPDQALSAVLLPDGRIMVAGFSGLGVTSNAMLALFTSDGGLDTTFSTNVFVQGGASFGFTIPSGWFSDPDAGDTLTYSVAIANGTGLPDWLSFDPLTNRFTGTPPTGAADAVLRLTATDSGGLSVSQLLTIRVNDAPLIAPQPVLVTNEDTPATAAAVIVDPDGDIVPSFVVTTQATHGTASIGGGGAYTYTPFANYNGSDSFVVTATDPYGASTSQTINVTVNPVNDAPPVAVNDTATTNEDVPVTINVLANDTDVDNIAPGAPANAGLSIKAGSVSVVGGAATGSAQIVGNQIQFTPAANFNGTATISYVATDGTLDSAPATVTVNVTPVNDAPYVANLGESDGTSILDADGAIVTTSIGPGQNADSVGSIALQSDGKIVVVGNGLMAGTTDTAWAVLRYNPDGSLDTTFNGTGRVVYQLGTGADVASSVVVQSDGKILVTGSGTFSGTGRDVVLMRFNPDGSFDESFGGGDGIATAAVPLAGDDAGISAVIQPGGRIVVTGFATGSGQDLALFGFLPDGSPDTTFGTNGRTITAIGAQNDTGNRITLQSDGRIVVTGVANNNTTTGASDILLARYTVDGAPDPTFGTGGVVVSSFATGGVEQGRQVVVLPDGRILVAGYTTQSATGSDFALLRYTANGALDGSFGSGGLLTIPVAPGNSGDFAFDMVVLPDGRILLGGFAGYSTTGDDFALLRLNADGSRDTSFGESGNGVVGYAIGQGASPDRASRLLVLPDGDIIVAGTSTTQLGGQDVTLMRFKADGDEDALFGTRLVVNEAVPFSLTLSQDFIVDPEGGTVTYSATLADGSPLPMWLSMTGTVLAGTPPVGSPSLQVRIIGTDPEGLSVSHPVTLQVNHPPATTNVSLGMNENAVLTIPLPADPDGDLRTYALTSVPTHGTVNFNSGTYSPAPNFHGTDSFTYTAKDWYGSTSTNTVTVNVAQTTSFSDLKFDSTFQDLSGSDNRLPTAGEVIGVLRATGSLGNQPVTWSKPAGDVNVSLASNGTITAASNLQPNTTYRIAAQATDSTGNTRVEIFDFVMGNPNSEANLPTGGPGSSTLNDDDILMGLGGDDFIYGGPGNDTLLGQAGNDVLRGGSGHDWLHGGSGSDRFVFGDGGQDIIADFQSGVDMIDLREVTNPDWTTFAEVQAHSSVVNGGLLINLDGVNTIYLVGVTSIVASDVLL